MSQELINRSPDLKRLRDEGFEVEVRSGHLVIGSVPYVNAQRQISRGVLVSDLTLAGNITTRPGTHVAYFIGDHPCTKDGAEILAIKHASGLTQLAQDLQTNHSFSNKPPNGYADYYEKMTTYITVISSPAKAVDPEVDARTFKVIESGDSTSVFKYLDTASSRASITAISERLAPQRLAIVGLGGTGSYVLDFVAKTPVREIHLFDDDLFLQHNAFRAPGAHSIEDLKRQDSKVQYFHDLYGRMRVGIVAHKIRIQEDNINLLQGYDFVFLCIDKGTSRKLFVKALLGAGIPFVDVGMGVEVTGEPQQLWGVCRVTTGTSAKSDHLARRIPMAEVEGDDLYAQNIQIADLNALNAAFAVIKWKRLSGVYADVEGEQHVTYSTNFNLLTSEETLA